MFPIKDNIPTDRFPFVTLGLLVANVVVYVVAIWHGGSLWSGPDAHVILKYGAIPYSLTHSGARVGAVDTIPAWQTVFTAMFMHSSLLQIAGDMLFLWIFGNTVEDSMGPVWFIGFYLVGGIVALALLVAIDPDSTAPTVGASGAIAAVLGGYILLYSRARVLTVVFIILFFTVIELPALWMLGSWFVMQALFSIFDLTNPTGSGGGAAYLAQLGGFVFGLLTIRLLAHRRKQVPPTSAVS